MSATQKVLYLKEKGSQFTLETFPIPKPGPGEVLIKVHSAALNPVDWKIQNGIFIEEFPTILGADLAGDIAEVGEGVTDFKKGDRVFGQGQFGIEGAGFQQYSVQLASTTAKIPNGFSYDDVSAIPGVLTCAYVGLYNRSPYGLGFTPPTSPETEGIYAGTPLVVLGGSGSVGQMVIQLAKISGFSPIITTASLKHDAFLRSIGATHVIDRSHASGPEIVAEAKKVTDKPIKAVFDAIALAETQQTGLDALAPRGQLALVLPPSPDLKSAEDKTIISVIGVLRLPHNIGLLGELYHDLVGGFLERGALKPNRVEVLPDGLRGIVGGLKRMEKDEISRLKLVARPQETV